MLKRRERVRSDRTLCATRRLQAARHVTMRTVATVLQLCFNLSCFFLVLPTKHSAHASPFRARGLSILATCSGEAWVQCLIAATLSLHPDSALRCQWRPIMTDDRQLHIRRVSLEARTITTFSSR